MHIGISATKIDISLEEKTKKISGRFSRFLNKGDVIFLIGEIGSGKTTFVKYLINSLQKKNNEKITEITSPTFSILNEYKVKDIKILHYDLYRLKDEKELKNIGNVNNDKNAIILVEWPEIIKNKISNLISLNFTYEENLTKRSLIIKTNNKKILNEFE